MSDYDLIVVGAGPGGQDCALHAARLGLKTALIERDEVGGTCLNRGCIPTKAVLHASDTYVRAQGGATLGVTQEGLSFDYAQALAYKDDVVSELRQGSLGVIKRAKIDLIQGHGRVVGSDSSCGSAPDAANAGGRTPHLVEIDCPDGTPQTVSAKSVVIATGSVPARPPIPGLDLPGVLTSDDLLDDCDQLFDSIVIIGGGVIGVEFATFYAELGCHVEVVEGLERLLPTLDRELGQSVALSLKAQGVGIHTGSMVSGIVQDEAGLRVQFTTGGEAKEVCGQAVLCAVGRTPRWEDAFSADIEGERRGRAILVNDRFETSVAGVYAIGDCSSPVQLAHVASAQGVVCADLLAGLEPSVDLSVVPSCVYCKPEIASVGMDEAQAKAAGIAVKVGKCVMGGNARTRISGVGRSFMKVVGEAGTGRIVGAQLMCATASDIVSQLSVAIAQGLTATQLLRTIRPHPTFEEALTEALASLEAKV